MSGRFYRFGVPLKHPRVGPEAVLTYDDIEVRLTRRMIAHIRALIMAGIPTTLNSFVNDDRALASVLADMEREMEACEPEDA